MHDDTALNDQDKELVRIAGDHAKARFSEYFISIGSALRTKDGKVYTGINLKYGVRNVSTCAEIMALYAALNDGVHEFDTIVGVKYFPDTDTLEVVNACGLCRQLFCYNTPLRVIINNDGKLEVVEAESLLPHAFL